MTITDVNTAFHAERAGQIEAARAARADFDRRITEGKLIDLGGGRYRVNEPGTWDHGETLRQQGGLILPEHGLDVVNGEAALYSAVPAWHSLGQIIPGGTTGIAEVLRLGKIDFGVEKHPARYLFDGRERISASRFLTVRTDTGDDLGGVGGDYQIIQNRDLFTFLEDLVAEHGVTWESAGAMRGGRKVFVTMRVPETVRIDRGGIDDEIILFLAVINTHDGSGSAQVVVTPWRPVCANTERFAVRDAAHRWSIRHTSGALTRIQEARRALGLTVAYAERFAAEETALARTDLAIDEFHALIADLWPLEDDATARTRGNHDRRRDRLDGIFRDESALVGRTAYAAERAITGYLDHVAPRRPGKTMSEEIARATAILDGSDDELKTKAHRRLMTLVRR